MRSSPLQDRKSTRLNSSHVRNSYAVFCLKKKKGSRKGHRTDRRDLGSSCSRHRRSQVDRISPASVSIGSAWINPGARSHVLFFFNDTATTEIYTLSLHDALPIWILALTLVRESQPTMRWMKAQGI